ncbi:hypothetical protein NSMM_520056 [Nitrosomonas mobilis]|uniref:Uncharacterized protein n=1 Tax=Nitrosomonas mobilis TaxID=51642 RepID=A0A1G5SGS1_9PROT|nr:hypothetical protein NSMM_520056 [Nitrosomonas mobilis]
MDSDIDSQAAVYGRRKVFDLICVVHGAFA